MRLSRWGPTMSPKDLLKIFLIALLVGQYFAIGSSVYANGHRHHSGNVQNNVIVGAAPAGCHTVGVGAIPVSRSYVPVQRTVLLQQQQPVSTLSYQQPVLLQQQAPILLQQPSTTLSYQPASTLSYQPQYAPAFDTTSVGCVSAGTSFAPSAGYDLSPIGLAPGYLPVQQQQQRGVFRQRTYSRTY